MNLLILFIFIAKTFCNNELDFVNNFLIEFGYKDKSETAEINLENISPYIYIFQEYHKLTVDGQLNNETLDLMKSFRCGNKDIEDFQLWGNKWNKTIIKWHYYLGRPSMISLAKQAFDVWEKYSGLTFEHNVNDYNILIVDKRLKHNLHLDSTIQCGTFVSFGSVLGHAYRPYFIRNQTEIHINYDQLWYYKNDSNVPLGQTSLLYVLIHEIGHTLGLLHSHDKKSVMYSTYNLNIGSEIDLSDDDKLAIQSLYGLPSTTTSTTEKSTSTTEKSTSTSEKSTLKATSLKSTSTEKTSTEEAYVDLCKLKNVNKFLIINKKIYIVHGKMFWKIENGNYETHSLLTDWLFFIPTYFTDISGMYQRPSGDVILIIDNYLYVFEMNTLNMKSRYSLQQFGFNKNVRINCIFNSYTGKTFIIHNDQYVKELDECGLLPIRNSYITDTFSGIPMFPLGVDSCFRYNDGFLYFFINETVYKYNEFTDESLKVIVHPLSIVKIQCRKDVIKNIIEMLQSIIR